MLHPEELDRVDFICKTARGSLAPFGGLQLICCGDFFQIPPVKQEKEKFVIDCAAWKSADMKTCYLHEQHRQGDAKLLEILAEIRRGVVKPESLALLRSRIGASLAAPIGVARLYTHNENVDEINAKELQKLTEASVVYEVFEKGSSPQLIEKLKRDYKIDRVVLKKGTRVMFTRNNMAMGYVNGTLGEVVEFVEDELASELIPVVLTFDRRRILVSREEWELEENGKVRASVEQMPLKLAWAITIHKSQGMTLDAAEIDLSRAFDRGMGYVALSRVKRLENISLLGLNEMALEVSARIKALDVNFLEQSVDAEAYLAKLGADGVRRGEEAFLNSAEETVAGDIHYEIDEVLDFAGE